MLHTVFDDTDGDARYIADKIAHLRVFTDAEDKMNLSVLDVGGAVKRGHLDLYHGMGEKAGVAAGHYKHFGRVWKLGLHHGPTAAPWL